MRSKLLGLVLKDLLNGVLVPCLLLQSHWLNNNPLYTPFIILVLQLLGGTRRVGEPCFQLELAPSPSINQALVQVLMSLQSKQCSVSEIPRHQLYNLFAIWMYSYHLVLQFIFVHVPTHQLDWKLWEHKQGDNQLYTQCLLKYTINVCYH